MTNFNECSEGIERAAQSGALARDYANTMQLFQAAEDQQRQRHDQEEAREREGEGKIKNSKGKM